MTKARDLANASTALGAVSATELAYLDGVTSAVQTQIDGKQAVNANVSTTELGYLDGVTSAIQTQLDAKTAKSTLTTTGDIYYASAANTPARLGIGSSAQVLTVAGGVPSWATVASSAPTLNETVFTASGTFTPAAGVTKVWVEIIGGGGSGANGSQGGGGGSAGGTINQQFTVTPTVGVTVTIGAGGASKTSQGPGNNGTGSLFDTVTAEGGSGGAYNNSQTIQNAESMGGSAFGSGKKQGNAATANGGAGGGGNSGTGGAGGSGRVTVRWVA